MNDYNLPEQIVKYLDSKEYTINNVGMSNSEIRIYDQYVLKIQPHSTETDNEYQIIKWLDNCIPVPEVIVYHIENGLAYTLMSKADGDMLCSDYYLKHPELLIKIVAKAFKLLWEIDIKECPCTYSRLAEQLKIVEYKIVNNLINIEDIDQEILSFDEYSNLNEILLWLKNNQPKEDLVLTHGDFCLPNVFIKNDEISSFIDLGKMGVADRWQDIAIVIRSLKYNFEGRYTDGK